MNSFHNTISATGQQLLQFETECKKQDEIILEIFTRFKGHEFTPFEIEKICLRLGYNFPITSYRRAITNLTKAGKLIKTNITRNGLYGKINYTWRLNK